LVRSKPEPGGAAGTSVKASSLRTLKPNAHQTMAAEERKYKHALWMSQQKQPQQQQQQLEELLSEEEMDKTKRLNSSYVVLAILLLTFAMNQWSRQALYYLCNFSESGNAFEHINVGLGFDKEMYAALASFGFTFVFAAVSLVAGGVSDKVPRNRVTAFSCAIWSLGTALQAGARGFTDLVPLRAVIGASQAFYNPAAYTLISDIFPKKMVGTVNGIFSGGVYLGGALASLSILLDGQIGWRSTLLTIGGIGLVTAAACLVLVPEPRNEKATIEPAITAAATTAATTPTTSSLFSDVLTAMKAATASSEAKLLFTAAGLRFCAGFSIVIWKAPFVFAKFPGSASAFAGSNAAVVAVGGVLSSLLGGYISDKLSAPKDPSVKPRARAWVPAVGSILAAPFWAAFILTNDPGAAAVFLFFEYLTAECWFGPTLAALFEVVPKERRGTAQGLFSVLTAAGNIAPVVVGALAGGTLANFPLGSVLIAVVSGAYVLSGLLFALAALQDEKRLDELWRVKSG